MSLFHFHKWKAVAANKMMITAMGYWLAGIFVPLDQKVSHPETEVLYRCQCGKAKTERIKGHWELEMLAGDRP